MTHVDASAPGRAVRQILTVIPTEPGNFARLLTRSSANHLNRRTR
ncbi:hypothetical protein CDS [Bradyrhizobium sp.]|nr:hypothetical protein CDS [Bradyrhizobium sp.]